MSDDSHSSESGQSNNSCNDHCPKRSKTISDEQEREIIRLNHEGKNALQISKLTGIPRTSIGRCLDYLKLEPKNDIKDNRWNITKGKWYGVIQYIKDELLPYYRSKGIPPSLRTIYYRLEAEGLIKKTQQQYDSLSHYTVAARLGVIDERTNQLRFPKLPIDCFTDETRGFESNYDASDPSSMKPPGKIPDSDSYIENAIRTLKNAPGEYDGIGFEGEDGQMGGYWYNQPEYVEVWIEKFALSPTFKKFLEERYVNLIVNKGYSSLTFLWHNCQRLLEKIEEFGRDYVHVLYFGDFDPSGTHIDERIEYYFKIFGVPIKVLERVAITQEQIEEYDIPTRPINENDTRTNGFIEKYGEDVEAADLDAFFAADDEIFEELVRKSVDKYWSQNIYDELEEEYDRKADPPPRLNNKQLREVRGLMYQRITDSFYECWDEYYKEYDEENMDPYNEDIDDTKEDTDEREDSKDNEE